MHPPIPNSSVLTIDTPAEEATPRWAAPFRSWLIGTLLLTLAASAAFVLINIRMDFFGLHGAQNVRISTLQRFSLYLMSYRFIPSNFDGLLIGNSAAAGYDTSSIHDHRIFNAAMRGASITEERILADQVLRRGHLKLLVMVLNPHMTTPNTEATAYMTPHDYTASYGSMQTIIVGLQGLLTRFGHPGPIAYNDFGQTIFPLKHYSGSFSPYTNDQLAIDPRKMTDLRDLLTECHAKHVRVYVLFFGPVYQPRWDGQQVQLIGWRNKILAAFSPEDTVIEIPAEVTKKLQGQRENFPDFEHLTDGPRATVMEVIQTYVDGSR